MENARKIKTEHEENKRKVRREKEERRTPKAGKSGDCLKKVIEETKNKKGG